MVVVSPCGMVANIKFCFHCIHGENNSVDVTEFSITWSPRGKTRNCRNKKISGDFSAQQPGCSRLSQPSFNVTECSNECFRSQRYYFSSVSFSSGPHSVARTAIVFRRALKSTSSYAEETIALLQPNEPDRKLACRNRRIPAKGFHPIDCRPSVTSTEF